MVYMDHICIYSSISGHLVYVHVLAIVNSAAMDMEMHVSFQMMVFFFFLDKCLGAGLLDHMVALCLVFQRNLLKYCSQSILIFWHPINQVLFFCLHVVSQRKGSQEW